MNYLFSYISALLFGLGLGISGMTDPSKVIGFLNIFGSWQPDLIFVMVGAIAFHSITFKMITKRQTPLFNTSFSLPTKKQIDGKLVLGSLFFGIGWGLAGYCPGPVIASLVTLSDSIFTFIGAMLTGMAFFHYIFKPLFLGKETPKALF